MSNGEIPRWDDPILFWDDGVTLWDGGLAGGWIEQPSIGVVWEEQIAADSPWVEQ